jgi:hypothetical protein
MLGKVFCLNCELDHPSVFAYGDLSDWVFRDYLVINRHKLLSCINFYGFFVRPGAVFRSGVALFVIMR